MVLAYSSKRKRWRKRRRTKKREREKEREKKKREGILKKGEWERKGVRVSQLALHAMALHFSKKTFHRLAPPNLTLARLQSLAITLICCQLLHSITSSPNTLKEEECTSYDPGLCYSTSFRTCSYAKKGDILCTSNPKALRQRIMLPRSMVSTYCYVYNLALLFAWVGMVWVLSSASSSHQKEESSTTICDHATTSATPRLWFIYAAGNFAQVCAKVSQCSSILHSYLSPFEHSLIL